MSFVKPSRASIEARNKRIKESAEENNNRTYHYKEFIKKRALNIKNKETWNGKFKVDKKGYLV